MPYILHWIFYFISSIWNLVLLIWYLKLYISKLISYFLNLFPGWNRNSRFKYINLFKIAEWNGFSFSLCTGKRWMDESSCCHVQSFICLTISPKTLLQYSLFSIFFLFVYLLFCFHLIYFSSYFAGFKVACTDVSVHGLLQC